MKWRGSVVVALVLVGWLCGLLPVSAAEKDQEDLSPRLQEIYRTRAHLLLTEPMGPDLAVDYLKGSNTAQWALQHEQGKYRYMKQWAENRGVQIVEAMPHITAKYLSGSAERRRYYVTQSLSIGYLYPGEHVVNRFGVGTRHVIELRKQDGKWVIALEWYTDPLGDDTEVPDVTPASAPMPLPLTRSAVLTEVSAKTGGGYDRTGALRYADMYCGLAWGCGNNNRYNSRYRDYNGVGGDCTNYVVQALREGGKLNVPNITRVDALVGHLRHTGKASITHRASFQALWKQAASTENGFRSLLTEGDLIAYQEKGKLEHFAIVTGFDTRGYPLVNSHTADRYRVPFDLGWDRKTVYWLVKMH